MRVPNVCAYDRTFQFLSFAPVLHTSVVVFWCVVRVLSELSFFVLEHPPYINRIIRVIVAPLFGCMCFPFTCEILYLYIIYYRGNEALKP